MRYSLIRWSLVALFALLMLPVLGYAFFKDTPLFTRESGSEPATSSSRQSTAVSPEGAGSKDRARTETKETKALRVRASKNPAPEKKNPDKNQPKIRAEASARLPAPEDSCDDLRVMVDKKNSLPPDYEPQDLVSLDKYGVPNKGDSRLRRETAEHLRSLVLEAQAAGIELLVDSAYRSYAQQKWTFANYSFVHGSRKANAVSARPGHSQHQLGTTVDFTNSAVGYQLLPVFGKTAAGLWLDEHARDHGFVMPYTRGAETETGVQSEPWHYRYIGVGNAKRLQKSGLSVQSFLAREGVRPRC